MELRVKQVTIPEVIEFNYEEIKAEITEKVKTYASIVYGEDEIKQAKADKANLNKFIKALADERIRVKKQCLMPYEDFERKVKEITDIVQEPIGIIDSQIKGYEEKKKAEKMEKIKELYAELEKPDWLSLDQVFNEKFLNASCNMTTVKQYLLDSIKRITKEMEIIEKLPQYSFETMAVYKECLDLNTAVTKAQKMGEIAKAKAESEEKKVEPRPITITSEEIITEDPKQWVKFQAYMTVQQAKDLGWFFRTKGIEFKPI